MDKTILNQRVRVTEYHYEDYDGNWEEGGHILLDTATGSVCVETNGDPLFFDSWDEMLETGSGMEEAVLGQEWWLEQYLTDDRNVPAELLDDTEWLEADEDAEQYCLREELERDFGFGATRWLAEL